jgi:hypothetical protein
VTTGLSHWQNEYFSKVTGQDPIAVLSSDGAQYITAQSPNVSGGEELMRSGILQAQRHRGWLMSREPFQS